MIDPETATYLVRERQRELLQHVEHAFQVREAREAGKQRSRQGHVDHDLFSAREWAYLRFLRWRIHTRLPDDERPRSQAPASRKSLVGGP